MSSTDTLVYQVEQAEEREFQRQFYLYAMDQEEEAFWEYAKCSGDFGIRSYVLKRGAGWIGEVKA